MYQIHHDGSFVEICSVIGVAHLLCVSNSARRSMVESCSVIGVVAALYSRLLILIELSYEFLRRILASIGVFVTASKQNNNG